jgi:hypothetical protein
MMLRRLLFSVQFGHVGPAGTEKRDERDLSFSMAEVYGRRRGMLFGLDDLGIAAPL